MIGSYPVLPQKLPLFIWDEDICAKSVIQTFASSCILKRAKFSLDGNRMESALRTAIYILFSSSLLPF
jgi:hypothetical protein